MGRSSFTDENGTSLSYRYYLPEEYAHNKNETYPLVLFLHGAGERGNDNTSQIKADSMLMNLLSPSNREEYPCIAIAPQCPAGKQWMDIPSWDYGSYQIDEIPENEIMTAVINLIKEVESTYRVDSRRIYIAGLSMGGYGAWDAIIRYSDLFAGAVICCGAGDPSKAEVIKDMPIWVFHGDADTVVPVSGSRDMVDALKKAGSSLVKYTEMPGYDHVCWPQAFATQDLFPWLFAQEKPSIELSEAVEILENTLANVPAFQKEDYTLESYRALQNALKAAKDELESEAKTVETLEAAKLAVNNAVDGMKPMQIYGTMLDYTGGTYIDTFEFGKTEDQYKRYQTFKAEVSGTASSIEIKIRDRGAVSDLTVEVYALREDNKTVDTAQLLASTVVAKSSIDFGNPLSVPLRVELEAGKYYAVALGQVVPSEGDYQWDTYDGGVEGIGTDVYFIKWNKTAAGKDSFIDETIVGSHSKHGYLKIGYVEYSKKGLQDLIEQAKALDKENYTAASYAALQQAIAIYNNVLQNSTDVDAVMAAEAGMQKAIDNLQPAQYSLEMKELEHQINLSDALDSTLYMESDAKTTFVSVLQEAKALLTKANENPSSVTQEEINAMATKLHAARAALRLIPNKDALKELLNKTNNYKAETYTTASYTAFKVAVQMSTEVYNDTMANQDAVDKAVEQLNTAIDGLVANSGAAEEPGTSEEPGTEEPGGNENPTTGSSPLLPLGVLFVLAGVSVVLPKRRGR